MIMDHATLMWLNRMKDSNPQLTWYYNPMSLLSNIEKDQNMKTLTFPHDSSVRVFALIPPNTEMGELRWRNSQTK